MTEKDLKETTEEQSAELADAEIEEAAGGTTAAPGSIYNLRPGGKFE